MPDLQYQNESSTKRTRQVQKKKGQSNWIKWLIPLTLWLGLALGSYFLATHTIQNLNQQLEQIQHTNQVKVEELNQNVAMLQEKLTEVTATLSSMEEGLQLVQEDLSLAGDTFNSSDETKQALSQQITSLNKELEGLRKSIQKLEEAARVY